MAAYVPVYCDACAQASLWPYKEEAEPRCWFCESTGRVIPGPAYGEGDWLAFAEIDRALSEAELLASPASKLADELQDLLDGQQSPLLVVERMIERLPVLANVRPALINGLPRGPRMLMTLLRARTRNVELAPDGYPRALLELG
jgi:hypothetical protein